MKYFVIENNITELNQQFYSTKTGIWIDDAKFGTVRNNIIRHNQVGIKVSKSENIIVLDNLIYKNNQENNIFSNTTNGYQIGVNTKCKFETGLRSKKCNFF